MDIDEESQAFVSRSRNFKDFSQSYSNGKKSSDGSFSNGTNSLFSFVNQTFGTNIDPDSVNHGFTSVSQGVSDAWSKVTPPVDIVSKSSILDTFHGVKNTLNTQLGLELELPSHSMLQQDELDLESQQRNSDALNELSRTQRFKAFIACLMLSGFFFLLASLFLPTVVVFPQKFAFCFTLGSLLFLGSFAILNGTKACVGSLVSKEKRVFVAVYGCSMIGTLYSALFWKRYVIIIFFSGAQIVSLVYYAASSIPGGRMGLTLIYSAFYNLVSNGVIPCCKLTFKMFESLFS